MQKTIQLLKMHKYNTVTVVLGGFYFWFLTYAHDGTVGDYQGQVKSPVDVWYGLNLWFNWSSRLLIENAVNLFSKDLFLWQIITVLCGAVLFWSIGRILGNSKIWHSIVLLLILFLTNFYMLASAGIFATTVNYLWPMACFAFVVAIIIRPFSNRTLGVMAQITVWPLYIFAMCSEQLAILGIISCISYIAYKLYNKEVIPRTIWALLGLSLLGVLNVLLSPGNSTRTAEEIINWWPGFEGISLISKITTGAITIFSRLILAPEVLVIVLVGAVLILSWQRKNLKAFISILPAVVLMGLFFTPATAGNPSTYIRLINYFNGIREQALFFSPENLASHDTRRIYLILFAIIGTGFMIALVYLYGKTKRTLVMLGALGAGLIVSLVVSLSPTLFASSTRTLYPLVVILLCVDYSIIQDIIHERFSIAGGSDRSAIRKK